MGCAYKLICDKCNYTCFYSKGGYMFADRASTKTIADMKMGRLGEELKRSINEVDKPAVEIDNGLFKCDSCGDLSGDRIYRLYEKNIPERTRLYQSRYRQYEDFDNAVYVDKFIYENPHICKCGAKMKRINGNAGNIDCPHCGGRMKKELRVLFD